MLGYLLAALALYTTTFPAKFCQRLSLGALGILFPWAGLQLLPFLAVLAVLIFVSYGFRFALNTVWLGVGAVIGLCALYLFYACHGVWKDFIASIATHAVGAEHSRWSLSGLLHLFIQDWSIPFMTLLAALLALYAKKTGNGLAFKDAKFGLLCSIFIPLGIRLAGVFPIYYEWMAAVPLALAVCQATARLSSPPMPLKIGAGILFAAAIAIGLPCRLAIAELSSDGKPYKASEQFISKNLNLSDIACIDYMAYYPARRIAKKVFTLRYLEAITSTERSNVTVLIATPEHIPFFTNSFSGNWQMVSEFHYTSETNRLPYFLWQSFHRQPTTKPYDLAVYRKIPDNDAK
jgi:hypothetical protein